MYCTEIFQKKMYKWQKKHMKKCSSSIVIKEMQIKATLTFHLTPVKIAVIKNTRSSKCWQGCRENGTLTHCCWECKLVYHDGKQYGGPSVS
jgi:hypothetical protein